MLMKVTAVRSIYMRDAGPVVVAEDRCACHLIILLKLASADLADLPIWDLDLRVVAEDRHHLLSPFGLISRSVWNR